MSLVFAVEKYSAVIDEMCLLYPAHWAEVGEDELDMDYDKYEELEKGGILHVVTARDCTTLVGYHMLFVITGMHCRNRLIGITDILYLKPRYRLGFNGIRLLRFTCESLKQIGVHRVFTTATRRNFYGKVLEWLGFCELEVVYTKVLR